MKTQTHSEPVHKIGQLFQEDLLLSQEMDYLWESSSRDGRTYDLYLGRITKSPVVRSRTTGKCFLLPWPQIVDLAIQAGVDVPSPPV